MNDYDGLSHIRLLLFMTVMFAVVICCRAFYDAGYKAGHEVGEKAGYDKGFNGAVTEYEEADTGLLP